MSSPTISTGFNLRGIGNLSGRQLCKTDLSYRSSNTPLSSLAGGFLNGNVAAFPPPHGAMDPNNRDGIIYAAEYIGQIAELAAKDLRK